VTNFTILGYIFIESVFLCDTVVKLKVVYNCFLTMFVEEVKLDEVRCRCPLEIKQSS
jgi:hypothetical protein